MANEIGEIKAMREALEMFLADVGDYSADGLLNQWTNIRGETIRKAREAVAAPPRNCDMPLVVDGPADNNADKAWLVFKHHNPDVYFDVSGLLRCIDWLLATATEQNGENNGSK